MTAFYRTKNNAASTVANGGSGYTAGAGQIVVADGAAFDPPEGAITAERPIVVCTFEGVTPQGVYRCTGRTGNALTGLTLLSGTDASLADGLNSVVRGNWTQEHAAQIQDALAVLEVAAQHHIDAFGAAGDGITDDSAALAAANAAALATGGVVRFGPKVYRIDGRVVIQASGTGQRPLRWVGAGCSWSVFGGGPYGGTILDLRYTGADSKILSLGVGLWAVEDLTLTDLGTPNSTPFVKVVNTVLHAFRLSFIGERSVTGQGCVQDAIVIGGTSIVTTIGDEDSPFQGYGTLIQNCFFNYIRRALYIRTHGNSVIFRDNTIWYNCGATSNEGCVELAGVPAADCMGNIIADNLIETPRYPHPIRLSYASSNTIRGNAFWDGEDVVAQIRLDIGATKNVIDKNFNYLSYPLISADPSATGNVVLTTQDGVFRVMGGGIRTDGPSTIPRVQVDPSDDAKWFGGNSQTGTPMAVSNVEVDPADATGNSYRLTSANIGAAIVVGDMGGIGWYTSPSAAAGTAVPRRLLMNQAGQIRIGPGSPAHDLHVDVGANSTVAVSGTGNPQIRVGAGDVIGKMQALAGGLYLLLGTESAHQIVVATSNTPRWRTTSDGYTGFNINSPGAQLHSRSDHPALPAVIAQAATDQTEHVLQVRNAGGTAVAGFRANGTLEAEALQVDVRSGAIAAATDGATITFDMAVSDKHSVVLGGNRTLAFANFQVGQVALLEFVQPASGGPWTVTWPAVRWAGGTAPVLTTAADKADLVTILKRADGTLAGALSMPSY